ncbi:MAG: PD-(D/E)XK nuclease family protein [Candidatus Micrarchaeota archaeon]|nr:PD-(D/E)XK nuclease family protein [Candidatus Micrarchaeota archaeon]
MSVLSELHKTNIRVSDIASQYWCERQMEYNYRYGQKITSEIKEGKTIHEELENEVNVPIILQPKSYADALYKRVYTSLVAIRALKDNKKTREIQLYGSIGGYTIVGKMDQLELKDGKVAISEDKTRANGNVPSDAQQLIHRIQLMVYRKLLGDLTEGHYGYSNFEVAYHVRALKLTDEFKRQLEAINVDRSLQEIQPMSVEFFNSIRSIGAISDTLYVRYINQFTGKSIKSQSFEYKEGEMDGIIRYILKYWNGERESMPVPENEKWKCRFCMFFGKECKVWWDQKAL